MLGTLLKKQLLEVNSRFFINRKTGKRRGIGGIIGFGILILFLLLTMCSMFGGYAFLMGELLFMGEDKSWIFYAVAAVMAMLLGIFGSVFSTYSSLYNAKDNELLLSMPIPPDKILMARMTGVVLSSLLYTSIVWIPMIAVGWILSKPAAVQVIFQLLVIPALAVFVTVIACALGWVVALVSGRLKNKSFITLGITLVGFAAYYYVCININTLLTSLIANSVQFGAAIKAKLFIVYEIALAARGDGLALIIFYAVTAVLFAICIYIMSRSFTAITTRNTGERKAAYKHTELKAENVSKALFHRELKHLTSNASYMLNSGLGVILAPIGAAAAIIKCDNVRQTAAELAMFMPGVSILIPAIVLSTLIMLAAMNNFSAPSVSLEGSSLWILQSLPVSPKDVLKAKEKLHIVLNTPALLILSAALCYVFELDISLALPLNAAVLAYIALSADMGLFLDLLNPNLVWSSETVPIKRSMSVTVMILGGWAIGVAVTVVVYLLSDIMSIQMILTVIFAVFLIAYRLVHNWLMTKGANRFANL